MYEKSKLARGAWLVKVNAERLDGPRRYPSLLPQNDPS
jgi:hypothetical protein